MRYNFRMKIINIEKGHPTSEAAINKLTNMLYAARATGDYAAKIIHGYGSTGSGGVIKIAVKRQMSSYISRRLIKSYMTGEEFGPFSSKGRAVINAHPDLKKDIDWGRNNDGITVVIFK